MSPRPSFAVSSTSAWLISSACARLSSAHGPAMSTTGRSLPSVRLPIWTWRCCISSTAPSPQPSPARGEGAHRVFPSPLAGTTRPTALRSAPRGFDRRAIERVVGGTHAKRGSNCVLAWLGMFPRLVIADHGVEGDEHFAHEGNRGDLRRFSGGDEALVEVAEWGLAAGGGAGCHVESGSHRG